MKRRLAWGLLLLPAALCAFQYEAKDVQLAFVRHDVRQLQVLAKDAEKPLRVMALENLIRLKEPPTVSFLLNQMDDSDSDIVLTSLWGLPNFGAYAATMQVITRVEEAQQHASVDVRKVAAIVLEDLHNPDNLTQLQAALTTKDSDRRKEALDYFVKRKDLSILMAARDMLSDADPFLKQTGIVLIHGLDDRDRLDAVTQLLRDPSPTVRATAVLVVGDWKEAAAFEELAPLLKDPEPLVRASVISTLGKHSGPDIATALAGCVNDKVPTVRVVLAKALAQFATPASTDGLLALVLDDNPLVRGPAIEGLVLFHNTGVTQKMRAWLSDKTSRKRRRAAVAYLSHPSQLTPPKTFLPLLHDKDDGVRMEAAEAILQMPGTEGKAQLVYLLDDSKREIRLVILRKLDVILKIPNVKKSVVKTSLTRLTKDSDAEVQALAKKYLPVVN